MNELIKACRVLLATVSVGDGKIICPRALLEPIRGIRRALDKAALEAATLEIDHERLLARWDREES